MSVRAKSRTTQKANNSHFSMSVRVIPMPPIQDLSNGKTTTEICRLFLFTIAFHRINQFYNF